MFPTIPRDTIVLVRKIFRVANEKVTSTFARQPSMHEEGLDFQLIAALDEVGPIQSKSSNAAIEIETHWLGGRRHFYDWEIADIALVIIIRRGGRLIARKVALLQSKRLYSKDIPIAELDKSDYVIGIGRLFDKTDPVSPITVQRTFTFSDQNVYGALTPKSKQISHIEEYMKTRDIPVFYSLYNPPSMPFASAVPRMEYKNARPC